MIQTKGDDVMSDHLAKHGNEMIWPVIWARGKMEKKRRRHTCVVGQGGHGALWWKHAFHSAGLLRVIEAEETRFTQTERITWREERKSNLSS